MKRSLGAKTLGLPTPVWVIGSYDKDDRPNMATIAWGGICCSEPPAVTIALRKSRHSYQAIMERCAFTVNIPSEDFVREADYAGMVSGKTEDKFATAGLSPVRSDAVDAPYVAEFPLVLECRLIQTLDLGVHTQFIGEIVDVKAEEGVLDADGLPEGTLVRPVVYNPGNRTYFGIGAALGKGFDAGRDLVKNFTAHK